MKVAALRRFFLLVLIAAFISESSATSGAGEIGKSAKSSRSLQPYMEFNPPTQTNGRNDSFPVPWRVVQSSDAPLQGLAVYWLPSSQKEIESSSLRFSKILALYSQQCVTMGIVDQRTPLGQKLTATDKLPVTFLIRPDGTVLGKVENKNGDLRVEEVEQLVDTEVKKREQALMARLENGRAKANAGDSQGAIAEYRAVLDQRCMFPGLAKEAARLLRKLGVSVAEERRQNQGQGRLASLQGRFL